MRPLLPAFQHRLPATLSEQRLKLVSVCHPAYRRRTRRFWYTWTAPSTGRFLVDTLNSSFDTFLGVYSGSSLTEVACNDDHNSYQSRSIVYAQEGDTYFFQVGSYGLKQGNVSIHVGLQPLNDDFSEAKDVAGPLFVDSLENTRATRQVNEPRPACNTSETIKTLWYRYTPATAGLIEIDTIGSSYNTPCSPFTPANTCRVFRRLPATTTQALMASSVTFTATACTTYYIQVGGLDHHVW